MPVGSIATKGALGEARTAGYRERRGMTDSGTRVPEVLSYIAARTCLVVRAGFRAGGSELGYPY